MYTNINLVSEDHSPKLIYFKYFGYLRLLAFGKYLNIRELRSFLLCRQAQ